MFDLEEELKKLPASPGVYLMHNSRDEIIYIGKAISLKNRVRQYFQSSRNKTAKIEQMVSHIAWFEYILTDSELEALVLECNLIKEHRPRYNTMLKDDKRSKEKEKVIADFLNYVRVHSDVWAKSGQVPASNAVDDMDEFKNMKQYLFIESPEEENAIVINTFRYGGYASDAFGVVLNDVLYGNMSIDDALAQVQKEVEDKIAQAQ